MELTNNPLLVERSIKEPKCYSFKNEKILGMFRVLEVIDNQPLYKISINPFGDSLFFHNLDIQSITEEDCFLIFAKFNPKGLYTSLAEYIKTEKHNSYREAQMKIRTTIQEAIFGPSNW